MTLLRASGTDATTAPTAADHALRERDIYRTALIEIADSESGIWGTIANAALRRAADLRDEASR